MEHFNTIKEVDAKHLFGITTDPDGWKNPMEVEEIEDDKQKS